MYRADRADCRDSRKRIPSGRQGEIVAAGGGVRSHRRTRWTGDGSPSRPRHGWADQERAMRRRLLGTIAAVAAGAGGAWAQAPAVPPPAPIGPAGSYPQVMTASGTADPIPPPIGGYAGGGLMPGGPMPGGPMGDPTGGG